MPFDPASRYDPDSMARIADDDIDPDAELFDNVDNRANFSAGGGSSVASGLSLDFAAIRRRRYGPGGGGIIQTALCVVISVTVLVVLSMEVAKAVGGGSSASTSSGAAVPPASSPQQFVPPPDDLATRCAPLSVSTRDGWDGCQLLCSSAECCFLDGGHWFSCVADHEEDCSAYEYGCKTLDHIEELRGGKLDAPRISGGGVGSDEAGGEGSYGEVPAAPQDLADLCAADSIAAPEGHGKCETACYEAACCDDDDDGACTGGADNCAAFHDPCSVLRGAAPSTHPDAPASLANVKCNTQALNSVMGVQDCAEVCEGAMCCFDGGENGCAENGEWCAQYGPCHMLLTLDGEQSAFLDGSDAAKAAIDDACGRDYQECVHMCSPAECCFANGGGYASSVCSALGLDDVECGHYGACAILFETTVVSEKEGEARRIQLGEAPSNLVDVCKAADAEGGEGDREAESDCDAYCEDSHCCAESVEHCVVVNDGACAGYIAPCAQRWSAMAEEVSVPLAPSDLGERCAADLGSDECTKACQLALCCDLPSDECVVARDRAEVCGGYDGVCQPLWGAFRLEDGPSNLLKAACDAGTEECGDKCSKAACCSEAYGCDLAVANKAVCDEYRDAGCADAWEKLAAALTTNNT